MTQPADPAPTMMMSNCCNLVSNQVVKAAPLDMKPSLESTLRASFVKTGKSSSQVCNGLDPAFYLRSILARIPEHPINRIEDVCSPAKKIRRIHRNPA